MEYPGWSLDSNATVSLPSHDVLESTEDFDMANDDDADAAMIVGVNRYVESRKGCNNQRVLLMDRPSSRRPVCARDSNNMPMVVRVSI